MSRFEKVPSLRLGRFCGAAVLPLFAIVLSLPTLAFGQGNFTLTATPFQPFAIDQGANSALSTVTLAAMNGFSSSVSLTCTVAPASTNAPPCQVSPTTVTPSATASLIVTGTTASGVATPGSYTVTVVGTSTSPAMTAQQTLSVSVLAVSPSYTVTVATPLIPSSVHAGDSATATININPVSGYMNPGVWLSCASVSPLTGYPPSCSFSPQPAPVGNSTAPTLVTMTVTAEGNPQQNARNSNTSRRFYALWLPLPLLAFAGLCAGASRKSRKAWGLLAFFMLAGSLLFIPACGNTSTGSTTPTTMFTTPKGTYIFTLVGVDSNGLQSTDSGGAGVSPTVTLTVN